MRSPVTATLLVLLLASPVLAAAPRAGTARAPDFELRTRQGTVSLIALRGKVVLVDFWASWCGPCRLSFPWMNALHERYGEKGLVIVAIDLDKDRSLASAFLEELPAKFTVAFDPVGHTAEAYQVSAMPSTFLIGPQGDILYRHAGFDPRKTRPLEDLIQEACAR